MTGADETFAIDELADRSGLSVRTIRAHQSRRLLHPPVRVGRSSVYDESHVERLALIQRLQNSGFSLAAIRALVQAGGDAGELALAWHAEAVAMRFLPADPADDAKLAIDPAGLAALLRQPGALDQLEGMAWSGATTTAAGRAPTTWWPSPAAGRASWGWHPPS